jgi:ATP-dependent helicase/nuclease subunit A
MTRAIDRLIISGAVDPTSRRDERAPLRWLLDRLEADVATLPADRPAELERDGARVLVRTDRRSIEEEEVPVATADQLPLFVPADGGAARLAPELPPLAPIPEPPATRIRRLSYSALALFERCSYRFYAERIVGLRAVDAIATVPGIEGLAATEIGDAVHLALERDLEPHDARERALARYPDATPEDLERIGTLVQAWGESPLAARLAGDGVRRELGFAFEHDGVLLHGRFDLFGLEEDRALVVDYKTNRLEGLTPADVVEGEYVLQRLVYALAAFRAGAEEVEVAYVFLERPDEPVVRIFTRSDTAALETELSNAIAAINSGRFRPTPSELACPGCPALDVVCAGPRLLRSSGLGMPGPYSSESGT